MQLKILHIFTVFVLLIFLPACTFTDLTIKPVVHSATKVQPLAPPVKINTPKTSSEALENQKRVFPIIMYHSITDVPGNNLCIPPEIFEKQIKQILDAGYTPITAGDYVKGVEGNFSFPKNPIILTFDDGYKDNYTRAFPIMKKYQVKGSIFPFTNAVDKHQNFLTSSEIKEMDASGLVDFGSHTANHVHLSEENTERVRYELTESKKFLENVLGKPVTTFCYPYGDNSPAVIKQVKEAGYAIAFADFPGGANYKQQYLLPRYYVTPSSSLSFLNRYKK